MKSFLMVILLFLITLGALGAGIPFKPQTDEFVLGRGANGDDKILTVNIGDGVANPVISIDDTLKLFDFNKGMSITGPGTFTGNIQGLNGTFLGELNVSGNDSIFGDGTSVDKKQTWNIGAGVANPYIGYSNSAGALVFNNGTGEKKIGAGGGGAAGGISIIENGDFEGGISDAWNLTGGASVVEITTGVDLGLGEKSAKVTYASAGTYCSDLKLKPNALGFGCVATNRYKDAGTDHKVKVYDNLSNVLVELDLLASTEWTKIQDQTFECKSEMKICFEGVSGSIVLDDVYLGNNKNFVTVQEQAKFVGSIEWAPTAGCLWNNTSTSFTSLPSDADCDDNARTVKGLAQDSSNGLLPQITFSSLKKGHYKIVVTGTMGTSSGNVYGSMRMSDGVNFTNANSELTETGSMRVPNMVFGIDYDSDQSNVTFISQVKSGAGAFYLDSGDSGVKISVYYYPDASQVAWYPEAQNFYVNANIGGANQAFAVNSSPTTISNASFDMVLNSGLAKIPCTSGNSPSGLTCSSGDEELGISVNIPVVGKYKYCFSWASDGGRVSFRLAETELNSTSIKQQGKSIAGRPGSANAGDRLCDYFTFDSVGEKVVRLMYEAASTGTMYADRNATVYEPDMNITVELVSEGVNKPYVLNQVDTTAKGGTTIRTCYIQNNGAASYDTSDPACDFIDNVSRAALGHVVVNTGLNEDFVKKCSVSGVNISETYIMSDGTDGALWANGDLAAATTTSTGAFLDRDFNLTCFPNR